MYNHLKNVELFEQRQYIRSDMFTYTDFHIGFHRTVQRIILYHTYIQNTKLHFNHSPFSKLDLPKTKQQQ